MPFFKISDASGTTSAVEFPNDPSSFDGHATSELANSLGLVRGGWGSYHAVRPAKEVEFLYGDFTGWVSRGMAEKVLGKLPTSSTIEMESLGLSAVSGTTDTDGHQPIRPLDPVGRRHYWTPEPGAIQPGVNPKNQWRQRKLSYKRKGQNQTLNATHNPTAVLTPAGKMEYGSSKPTVVPDQNGFGGPTGFTVAMNNWLRGEDAPVGDSTTLGYSEKAISRIDEVPEFVVESSNFQLGVVAFHYEGIDKIKVQCDGENIPCWITSATHNTRTDVHEWTCILNNTLFGRIAETTSHEIRFTVYPVNGIPRRIATKFWVDQGTLTANDPLVYCSVSGHDVSGDGTLGNPYRHIPMALMNVYHNIPTTLDTGWIKKANGGGKVILKDAGRYVVDLPGYYKLANGEVEWKQMNRLENNRWISIEASSGLAPSEVELCSRWGFDASSAEVSAAALVVWEGVGTPGENAANIVNRSTDVSAVYTSGMYVSAFGGLGRCIGEKYITKWDGTSSLVQDPRFPAPGVPHSNYPITFTNVSGDSWTEVGSYNGGSMNHMNSVGGWKRIKFKGVTFDSSRINNHELPSECGLWWDNCIMTNLGPGTSACGFGAREPNTGYNASAQGVSALPKCWQTEYDITPMVDPHGTYGIPWMWDPTKFEPSMLLYTSREAGHTVTIGGDCDNSPTPGSDYEFTYLGASEGVAGNPGDAKGNYTGSGVVGGVYGYVASGLWTKPLRPSESMDFLCYTECSAINDTYGLPNGTIARNCYIEECNNDIWKNPELIVNCYIKNIDGAASSEHTDFFQVAAGSNDYNAVKSNCIMYGCFTEGYRGQLIQVSTMGAEAVNPDDGLIIQRSDWNDKDGDGNLIYPNINAAYSNSKYPRGCIFRYGKLKDYAIVNCAVSWETGPREFANSNIGADFKHCLFDNCTILVPSGTCPSWFADDYNTLNMSGVTYNQKVTWSIRENKDTPTFWSDPDQWETDVAGNVLSGNVPITVGPGLGTNNPESFFPSTHGAYTNFSGSPVGLSFRNCILTGFQWHETWIGENGGNTLTNDQIPTGFLLSSNHYGYENITGLHHGQYAYGASSTSGTLYIDKSNTSVDNPSVDYHYGIGIGDNDYADEATMIADLSGTGQIIPGFNHPNSGSITGIGGGNPNGRPNIGAFSFKLLGGSQVDPTF